MSIFTAIYQLLIGPLEFFFETVFVMSNRLLENPGLAIMTLSLVMNFLVLPLYRRADAIQEEQIRTEARLDHWVRHIRKNFSGDERYMILQTYYRQNHYKPAYALRGSISLLLEIPFFMAAYNLLSGLQMLQGVSFGPIPDLGAPDGMLVLGSLTVNVLPIVMTAVNAVSSALYTKGYPLRSKLQLYLMAALFLVLLYDSPSGLVFYWTLNNVFSLLKTIFYKLKNPRRVLSILFSCAGAAGLLILLRHPMATVRSQVLGCGVMLMLQLPLLLYILLKRFPLPKLGESTRSDRFVFWGSCLFLSLLLGLLIPSAVIQSSPEEFVNLGTMTHPLRYLLSALLLASGTFLVWFGIFYRLASPAGKKVMSFLMIAFSGICLVNYLFFGTDLGLLTAKLQFETEPPFPLKEQLLNLLVLGLVFAAIYWIWKKKEELLSVLCMTLCVVVAGMSLLNVGAIQKNLQGKLDALRDPMIEQVRIPLSRNGKNVIVLMMDRSISAYFPYIMHENPELQEQFAGFTYFPNTLSYGAFTNVGTPALFGGYEYRPEEMNRRDQELLVDKHNEALKVMPVSFLQQGYDVTVCDPSYAGYTWIPTLSVYDDYPEIQTYITRRPVDSVVGNVSAANDDFLFRNFFAYSLFKTAPMLLQPTLYLSGLYNDPQAIYLMEQFSSTQIMDSLYTARGYKNTFLEWFQALKALPGYVEVNDSGKNTFLVMSNESTHEPCMLQLPAYEPAQNVDNREYEAAHGDRFTLKDRTLPMEDTKQVIHYHANMAGMLQIGRFLDSLRDQGVYDNTRIIIVGDHGSECGQVPELLYSGNGVQQDMMAFNPLLLYKDFGSTELTMNMEFMTQCDVPTLAFRGLIEDPVNPFTGKPINSDPKQGQQHVMLSYDWDTSKNNGYRFLPGTWFSVQDNIFDPANWQAIEDPSLTK